MLDVEIDEQPCPLVHCFKIGQELRFMNFREIFNPIGSRVFLCALCG
jgi:hypothetical protein